MKLIGIIVVRNEDWVLEACLRQVLRWVDEIVLVDHASHDRTWEIVSRLQSENPFRIHYSRWEPTEKKALTSKYPNPDGSFTSWEADVPIQEEAYWPEQDVRQHGLLLARKHGATHLAMIDADEILTSNLIDRVRSDAAMLEPSEVLEYPILCMRSLSEYQDDSSDWSGGYLSLVVRDTPYLAWKPAADSYWFHSRKPFGAGKCIKPLEWHDRKGGVMHLQFANERRLIAKHVQYRMEERLRWPDRMSSEDLNKKYDNALAAPKNCSVVSPEWWDGVDLSTVDTTGWPWQEARIRELIAKHGYEKFEGLDLKKFGKKP